MKKYIRELTALILAAAFFYLIPLFAPPYGAIGMVLFLIILILILSVVLGAVSGSKLKLFYPLAVAVVFIPSVFIFYNESALVHALWYFVVSAIGTLIGSGLRKLIR